MAWTDRLLPASYRGVRFHVARHGFQGGRRVVVHEFPGRDEPFVEDLGRLPREFSFDAYLVGDDWDIRLAQLREACESGIFRTGIPLSQLEHGDAAPDVVVGERFDIGVFRFGASILVHPQLGRLAVACTGYGDEVVEDRGRFARARISFVEAGAAPPARRVPNPVGRADAAADALDAEVGQATAEGLSVEGVPSPVVESIAADTLSLGELMGSLDIFSGPAAAAAAQAARVQGLIARASTLATSPLELVTATQAALAGIRDSVSNALGALFAYEAILGGVENTIPTAPSSTVEQLQATNGRQLASLFVSGALGGAVRAAARVPWSSLDDAVRRRDSLLERLEERMSVAGDEEFVRLQGLRAALVGAVPPPDTSLPSLDVLELPAALPAILISYRLYGTPALDADIVARNRVRHETFVPAGVALEVLASG